MQKAKPSLTARRPGRGGRITSQKAMTLVEVMIAFTVMIAVLCGSLTAMQSGYKAIDTARCSTLAAQIMQSRIEQLRLSNWTALEAEAARGAGYPVAVAGLVPAEAADVAGRFTLTQTVAAVTGRTGIMDISLTVTWTGAGQVSHTRSFLTRYAKNGLYDYYY